MENTFNTAPLTIAADAAATATPTKVVEIQHLMLLEQYLTGGDMLGLALALDVGHGFATYHPSLIRRFVDVVMVAGDQFLVQVMPAAVGEQEEKYAILVRAAE